MFHQIHCLLAIQDGIRNSRPEGGDYEERGDLKHIHHCLNYLRQMILCNANPTLERTMPEFGTHAINPGTERICRDWTRVYEIAESNYQEWKKGKKKVEESPESYQIVRFEVQDSCSRQYFLNQSFEDGKHLVIFAGL